MKPQIWIVCEAESFENVMHNLWNCLLSFLFCHVICFEAQVNQVYRFCYESPDWKMRCLEDLLETEADKMIDTQEYQRNRIHH